MRKSPNQGEKGSEVYVGICMYLVTSVESSYSNKAACRCHL